MRANTIDDFWSKVVYTDTCWLWSGTPNHDGYGKFRYNSKQYSAHVFSYMINVGEIPDGHQINHLCGNKLCVRSSHVYLGTHEENMRDKARLNEAPSGSDHWKSKLTWKDVREIREAYKNGVKQQKLIDRYGVSSGNMSKIVHNQIWIERD